MRDSRALSTLDAVALAVPRLGRSKRLSNRPEQMESGGEGRARFGTAGRGAAPLVCGGGRFRRRYCLHVLPKLSPLRGTVPSQSTKPLSFRENLGAPVATPIPLPSWPVFPGPSKEESLQGGLGGPWLVGGVEQRFVSFLGLGCSGVIEDLGHICLAAVSTDMGAYFWNSGWALPRV